SPAGPAIPTFGRGGRLVDVVVGGGRGFRRIELQVLKMRRRRGWRGRLLRVRRPARREHHRRDETGGRNEQFHGLHINQLLAATRRDLWLGDSARKTPDTITQIAGGWRTLRSGRRN